jgi:hypothetical protein
LQGDEREKKQQKENKGNEMKRVKGREEKRGERERERGRGKPRTSHMAQVSFSYNKAVFHFTWRIDYVTHIFIVMTRTNSIMYLFTYLFIDFTQSIKYTLVFYLLITT